MSGMREFVKSTKLKIVRCAGEMQAIREKIKNRVRESQVKEPSQMPASQQPIKNCQL